MIIVSSVAHENSKIYKLSDPMMSSLGTMIFLKKFQPIWFSRLASYSEHTYMSKELYYLDLYTVYQSSVLSQNILTDPI